MEVRGGGGGAGGGVPGKRWGGGAADALRGVVLCCAVLCGPQDNLFDWHFTILVTYFAIEIILDSCLQDLHKKG